MPWYDSIVPSLEAGASWLFENSGSALEAASAVQEVAKLFTAKDEQDKVSDLDDFDLTGLLNNFDYAQRWLVNQSQSAVKPSSQFSGAHRPPGDPQISVDGTLSGLWTIPAPLDSATNLPVPVMYSDVSKFLAIHGLPVTYDDNGSTTDIALGLCNAIFANEPVPPPDPSGKGNDSWPPEPVLFHYTSQDQKLTLTAAHTCYQVSLGKAGPDNAWHGSLYAKSTMTMDAKEQLDKKRRALNFHLKQSPRVGDPQSFWQVTAKILWATTKVAAGTSPLWLDWMQKDYGTYVIIASTQNGTVQTVKVQGPVNITPAQLRAAIEKAANDAASSNGPPSDKPRDTALPTVSVPVEVTDCTLIVPSSSQA